MQCQYCGAELSDKAVFCSVCGKKVAESAAQNGAAVQGTTPVNTWQNGAAVQGTTPVNTRQNTAGAGKFDKEGIKNKIKTAFSKCSEYFVQLKNTKKPGQLAVIAAAAVILLIVVGLLIHSAGVNRKIGRLEDKIYNISASQDIDEELVLELYDDYSSLSDSNKRKVANRQDLMNAYQTVEQRLQARKQAAAQVDSCIEQIDYSNIYAEANSVAYAVQVYNSLDEKAQQYVELYDELEDAYNKVKDLDTTVTADNFNDLFVIEYSVGNNVNYGGTTTSQSGYSINWDSGRVTPNYDIEEHNDYATPVYIYVQSRYENLISDCSFYINLHQTYNGIGLVDSDTHEFELQDGVIQYSSSEGIGEYVIYVENNDASNSLLNIFGWSYDLNDMVHQMNPFDTSRVEISDISGSVRSVLQ